MADGLITLTVYVRTDKVGSRCETTVEVPADDVEGLDADDRAKVLEEYARDAMFEMIEWGWSE